MKTLNNPKVDLPSSCLFFAECHTAKSGSTGQYDVEVFTTLHRALWLDLTVRSIDGVVYSCDCIPPQIPTPCL